MQTLKRKNFSLKLFIILCCAFVAAIATAPYGFRFAKNLENYHYFLFLGVGIFFGLTSLFANMALGAYSLINADPKQKLVNPYYLGMGSIVSAIPTGFMCYFGFKEYLPFFINLSMSLVVVVVN